AQRPGRVVLIPNIEREIRHLAPPAMHKTDPLWRDYRRPATHPCGAFGWLCKRPCSTHSEWLKSPPDLGGPADVSRARHRCDCNPDPPRDAGEPAGGVGSPLGA